MKAWKLIIFIAAIVIPSTSHSQTISIQSVNSYVTYNRWDSGSPYFFVEGVTNNILGPFQATVSCPFPSYTGLALAGQTSVISLSSNILTASGNGNIALSPNNNDLYEPGLSAQSYLSFTFTINAPMSFSIVENISIDSSFLGYSGGESLVEIYGTFDGDENSPIFYDYLYSWADSSA